MKSVFVHFSHGISLLARALLYDPHVTVESWHAGVCRLIAHMLSEVHLFESEYACHASLIIVPERLGGRKNEVPPRLGAARPSPAPPFCRAPLSCRA